MTLRNRRHLGKRGTTALEFGLWVPILALLLSGIIDFGIYITQLQTVTRAARDAARVASSVIIPPNATLSEIEAIVEPIADDVAQTIMEDSGLPCVDCAEVEVDEIPVGGGNNLRVIRVDVGYNFTSITGMTPIPNIVSSNFTAALDRQLVDE